MIRRWRRQYWGLVIIAVLGLGLRFWQIGRFNTFVFDEIYFAKFAQAYLAGAPQFDAHPPLGKYLIAVGIWLSRQLSTLQALYLSDALTTLPLSATSYRWVNALAGSCLPFVVVAIARSFSKNWTFALLAGGFVAIDGLFITESRYALLNIYVVLFGLLGHGLWLQANAQESQKMTAWLYRLLSGVALGCAIATKWNGLGYLLSLFLWEIWQAQPHLALPHLAQPHHKRRLRKTLMHGCLYGVLVPLLTYRLLWWPHLSLTGEAFIPLHQALLNFHQQLSSSHSACSPWYTWPLLIKPIAYWYEEIGSQAYTVNNMGNPALWWLSSAAMALLSIEIVLKMGRRMGQRMKDGLVEAFKKKLRSPSAVNLSPSPARPYPARPYPARSAKDHFLAYLVISTWANWLPWMLVSRCTFIYLYMPAAVFSFMGLAWLLSQWLQSPPERSLTKILAWSMLLLIALAFIFWLPLSLGSPLTPESLQLRWWLRSWI